MSLVIQKLNLNNYRMLNNIKDNLDESKLFLHWLRYHKQNIVFQAKQICISNDLNHFSRIKNIGWSVIKHFI